MTQLITSTELEDLNETELRSKYYQIIYELAQSQQFIGDYPLVQASLVNIETALRRRRLQRPKM